MTRLRRASSARCRAITIGHTLPPSLPATNITGSPMVLPKTSARQSRLPVVVVIRNETVTQLYRHNARITCRCPKSNTSPQTRGRSIRPIPLVIACDDDSSGKNVHESDQLRNAHLHIRKRSQTRTRDSSRAGYGAVVTQWVRTLPSTRNHCPPNRSATFQYESAIESTPRINFSVNAQPSARRYLKFQYTGPSSMLASVHSLSRNARVICNPNALHSGDDHVPAW
ncbi:hypothetical protein HD554DRAFT_1666003 [Boletus coccyginus]|nr:hypothetical protein HD554DRAFT_1666003 [Boletus coccyginus]